MPRQVWNVTTERHAQRTVQHARCARSQDSPARSGCLRRTLAMLQLCSEVDLRGQFTRDEIVDDNVSMLAELLHLSNVQTLQVYVTSTHEQAAADLCAGEMKLQICSSLGRGHEKVQPKEVSCMHDGQLQTPDTNPRHENFMEGAT
eukprot:366444-Chlamydomonas_euryale.AAC.18